MFQDSASTASLRRAAGSCREPTRLYHNPDFRGRMTALISGSLQVRLTVIPQRSHCPCSQVFASDRTRGRCEFDIAHQGMLSSIYSVEWALQPSGQGWRPAETRYQSAQDVDQNTGRRHSAPLGHALFRRRRQRVRKEGLNRRDAQEWPARRLDKYANWQPFA